MTDVEIIGLLKTYVNKTLVGGGALKGKNCTIDSIAPITGGNRVTFKWTLDDGTVETGHLDVMNGLNGQDGQDGQDGKGIQSVSVNENNHLIITYSDGTTTDAGQIEIHSAVDSVNGQTGDVVLDADDVGALPDDTPIPAKTSDLTNDSGFITKAVSDLVNYYLKSETYSKTQVDDIVTAIKNSRFEVVATLPTTDIKTNVIYLVPKSPSQTSNVKDEYINLDGTTSGWEKIGDTEIDLSDYVTIEALTTALAAYTTTADLTTLLAAKQDTLTFDNAPTANSNNPVKSGGVYAANEALTNKTDMLVDNGVVNVLQNTATTQTVGSEVTYTVNADKTVTATFASSPTASRNIDICGAFTIDKAMHLSGCPSGGGQGVYRLFAKVSNASTYYNDDGNGVSLPAGAYDYIRITVGTSATASASPLVFKPMISDPILDLSYNDYVPYAKTNRQLTAENQTLTNEIDKAYQTDDAAITEVASDDIIPIYDTSETAKKKIAVSNFIGGLVSNANLLDNPWFTVNQRGSSSYSGASIEKQYTFDRWMMAWALSDVSVTKNADGTITYTNNSSDDNVQLIQLIDSPEMLANRQITLSIDVVSVTVASGETISCRVTLNASPWTGYAVVNFASSGLHSKTGILGDASTLSASGLKVIITLNAGQSITFRAVKLELGSVSTLAMDTAPNYATELLKCQRYFIRLKSDSSGYAVIAEGVIRDSSSIWAFIPLPVTMRQLPTGYFSGIVKFAPVDVNIGSGGIFFNAIYVDHYTPNGINIIVNNSPQADFEVGKHGFIWIVSDTNAYIDLSADL